MNKTNIYIIFESRLSVSYLSPVKSCNVRWQNFACGRVPCVCRTWAGPAGSYFDRGRHWEEIKILKHCAYTCCGESHAAASFDFGRVAGVRRTPATSRSSYTQIYIPVHTAAPGHSEARRSNKWHATEAERIRSNAHHPDRGAQRQE